MGKRDAVKLFVILVIKIIAILWIVYLSFAINIALVIAEKQTLFHQVLAVFIMWLLITVYEDKWLRGRYKR